MDLQNKTDDSGGPNAMENTLTSLGNSEFSGSNPNWRRLRRIGQVVYGGCVEPGGMVLEDETVVDARCPKCHRMTAHYRYWETAEGCINQHWAVECQSCGHCDGDGYDEQYDYGVESM